MAGNLSGTLKLRCLQFDLLPPLKWPLTIIYEVPISKAEKLEKFISSFVKKWLGVPRCFSNIGLYEKGILKLLVSSLTEGYKNPRILV